MFGVSKLFTVVFTPPSLQYFKRMPNLALYINYSISVCVVFTRLHRRVLLRKPYLNGTQKIKLGFQLTFKISCHEFLFQIEISNTHLECLFTFIETTLVYVKLFRIHIWLKCCSIPIITLSWLSFNILFVCLRNAF